MSMKHAAAAEVDLAEQARRGDHDALVELYQRHKEPLYRHALRMLGDEASARDVVQESFARALEALDRTRPELRFRAWIFRIATNLCLRLLTRQRRRVVPRDDLDRLRDERATAEPPDRQHQRAEVGQRVAAALARLPDRYREILLLREVEELTYEELAHALSISVDNVKITLHRARARFAVIYTADQLATLPPAAAAAAVDCASLAALVAQAAPREAIEGHLRRCERCRGGRQPAAELLAALPVLPLPELPLPALPPLTSSPAGTSSTPAAGSSTATAGGGAAFMAVVIAALGLALAGTAAGAYLLSKKAPANTSAVSTSAANSSASNTGAVNTSAANTGASNTGASNTGASNTSATNTPSTKARGAKRRFKRRRPRRPPDTSHQALDDEDPPRAPSIP